MKKLVIGIITAIALNTSALAEEYEQQQPNDAVLKVLLMSQDMSSEQEDLAIALLHQVKSLASLIKSPKESAAEYLSGLAERDYIDVTEVMQNYKAWQQDVDREFEQSLSTLAELHASMNVEQRKHFMETIKQLHSN